MPLIPYKLKRFVLVQLPLLCSVFFADLYIKSIVKPYIGYSWPVISDIFRITVVYNSGAAFGIMRGHPSLLAAATSFFIVILFVYMALTDETEYGILLPLIAGGALSNFCDRLVLGYVVDYLDFRIWPVFNLSDATITVSIIILLILSARKKNGRT